MKRLRLVLTFVLIGVTIRSYGANAKTERPNVLFIAIDDLNNWALGNHTGVITPNIDRLAERGVRFVNAHCAAPACNPSRTAVLTGLRPSSSGVYLNRDDWRNFPGARSVTSIPEAFQRAGYRTVGGGKIYHAHTLNQNAYEGFLDPEPWDTYFPSKTRQMPQEAEPPQIPVNGNPKFYRGHFDWAAMEISDADMADGKVVKWAEQVLAQSHDKPLFLAVGIYRPHVPWYTPKIYFDRYPKDELVLPQILTNDLDDIPTAGQAMARRRWHEWIVQTGKWPDSVQAYLASVTFADTMVGRLLRALDEGPLAANTLVVLWSDHGYHLGHKEHWEKFALWEQATQVPLIIASPKTSKGFDCTSPASLLDLYPTLMELCSIEPPGHLDGKSLVPWLKTPKARSRHPVVTTHGRGNHAVRSDHWRYIRYADGTEELYDHRIDPNEFHNLSNHLEFASVKRNLAQAIPMDLPN